MSKPSDKLTQINTRRQVHLERVKSHEQGGFLSFFEQMRAQVLNLLNKDITTFRRRRLETQLKGLNEAIRNIHADYKDVWVSQIKELSKSDIQFQSEALGIVADFDFKLPPPSQVEAAIFSRPLSVHGIHGGELLTDFFDDVLDRDIKRLENVIRLGYAQGNTTREITSSVLGLAANNFKDGAMEKFKTSANSVVRTSLQHTSQVSRQSLYENNSEIIKGVEINATLDDRTSTICQSLDGQEFPLHKGPRPPFHINCRTTTTPVFDERFKFLQGGATRSARGDKGVKDGGKIVHKVDAKQTYYAWLKTQSKDFQDSAIGEKWGKVLRNGGLSSHKFAELRLDKRFQPLTLKEAKLLEPLAFNRAGL